MTALYAINEDGSYTINNHRMNTWQELASYLQGYGDALSESLKDRQ